MGRIEVEKSLKRYLKRKIKFSFSLLIAFLITGGFSFANDLSREELLAKIQDEKAKLEELLKENERQIDEIRRENLKLVREADFYVKPTTTVSTVSLLGDYKKADSIAKDYKGSVRTNTTMDDRRDLFNSTLASSKENNSLLNAIKHTNRADNLSSGWLNMSPNYAANTNTYDTEAKLFILPIVSPPTVKVPTAPSVSFTTPTAPTELNIAAPSVINVAMGAISVNAPTVNIPTVNIPTAPTAPTTPSVVVNEPNINIAIGAINVGTPGALTVPTLTAPVVNVDINPNLPPSIVPPNPTVVPPDSPEAPSFDVYVRKRGVWLYGVSGQKTDGTSYTIGFNNFDRRIDRFIGMNNTNTSINDAPFFNLGGTISGSEPNRGSQVIATSEWDSNGNLVSITNKYTNIQTDQATLDLYPDNKWFNPGTVTVSTVPFKGVAANTPVSNTDDGSLGASTQINNLYINKRQQNWIFQGAPTLVENMTITIGGTNYNERIPLKDASGNILKDARGNISTYVPNQGTAIFAQSTAARMKNVNINLRGRTTVADIDSQRNYVVNFENVDIDIKNDYNTIFALSSVTINGHRYNNTDNIAPLDLAWGAYRGDQADNHIGINLGTTNLKAETSANAVFYLIPPSTHRWNGVNQIFTVPAGANQNGNAGKSYGTNPGLYDMYYPSPGNIRVENAGTIEFVGSGNAGAWLRSFVPDRREIKRNTSLGLSPISGAMQPIVNLGTIKLYGDKNVAYYFADHSTRPNENAVFQGKLKTNVEIGTTLDGTSTGTTQKGTGAIGGTSSTKTEKNVAVFIASGQRPEMSSKQMNGYYQYYPATLSFKIDNNDLYVTNPSDPQNVLNNRIWGLDLSKTIDRNDIGAYQLGSNTGIYAKITNFDLSDFRVKFGKYSKESIGLVAKNGSVIDLGGSSTISDNADAGAEENIMVYAEGIWFNPRKKLTVSTYDKEAYARGESTTGQKYISDYNTTVNIKNNITMGSIKSTALFAKSGAKIDSANYDVTMSGHSSKAVLAHGTHNYKAGEIVDSNNANVNKQPDTTITVKNITAKANGTTTAETNANIAAAAISQDGSGVGAGKVAVNVLGNVDVAGVGAFARGSNATLTIAGNGSTIISGKNAGLVAKDGGTVNFGGGTITHNVDDAVAFFSEKTNSLTSKLNFTGNTTLNISKGIVFFGDKEDYSANAKLAAETGRYTGMNTLTVNLTGHGVNLGVFKDIDTTWDGTTTYVDGLKQIPKVAAINTGTYWYKSALDGGKLTVKTNVNRDSISSGSTTGDQFNDIVMERKQVILDKDSSGNDITISSTQGRTMAIASNGNASSNTESGYTLKNGTIDISHGANATTGAFVDFGHIKLESNGKIKVSEGVGAYGVNGSSITNEGTIEIADTNGTGGNIGIVAMAQKQGVGTGTPPIVQDTYGKVESSTITDKWANITNKGKLDIKGKDAIGIYVRNNYDGTTTPGANTTSAKRADLLVTNEAPIELGEGGKAIVIQSTHNNLPTEKEGATLTLKDSGNDARDIKVGKNGIGVYAESSDINIDGNYGMQIAEGGVAIQTTGKSNLTSTNATDVLTVEYKGAANGTAMALGYEEQVRNASTNPKTTTDFANNLNIELENTNGASTLVGLYANKESTLAANDATTGKLRNSGNITSKHTGSYGILSKNVDVENTGTITVGDITKTVSEAVGIYVENAALTTDGDKIKIEGHGSSTTPTATPIGIYAKADNNLTTLEKVILVNKGTNELVVNGKNAIGIYVEDESADNKKLKLTNRSDITLADSAATTERRLGIVLKNAKNDLNETNSTIKIGKNNIGIYNNNSTIISGGTLEVKHDEESTINIGAHNTGENFRLRVARDTTAIPSRLGIVDVEGRSGTIGISAITTGTEKGQIQLDNAQINIKATSLDDGKIPLGIYAKGDNIEISSVPNTTNTKFTVSPNAVGAYLEGKATTKLNGNINFSLSSENTKAKVGVGAYFKGGAYATTKNILNEVMKIESTITATNADGSIRPIGLFYGTDSTKNEANIEVVSTSKEVIGMYGKDLTTGTVTFANSGDIAVKAKSIGAYFAGTNVENTGKIDVSGDEGYGLYLQGGKSTSSGNMTASGKSAIATLVSGTGASLENKTSTTITASGDKSVGVYSEKGAEFINSGTLVSDLSANLPTISGSIGAFAFKGKLTNNGVVNSKNVGLYGTDESTITNTGTINITDGVAILANKKTTVNASEGTSAGTITGAANSISGIIAKDESVVNLSGTNISLTGDKTVGIFIDNKSKATLTKGNITVGKEGLGLYAKGASSANLSSYTGTFTLGNKGIGIYAEASDVVGGTLKVNYNGNTDTGVGIYYKDTAARTNSTTVNHTGSKLVNIFSEGALLTNTATQTVQAEGIGIYAKGGTLANSGTLTLSGDKTVGIFLDNGAKLTALGGVAGTAASDYKVGIYAKNGTIEGTQNYNFGIDNSVAMFLAANGLSTHTGTLNLSAKSATTGKRAIGIYTEKSSAAKNIATNVKVTGTDAIGMFLEGSSTLGSTVNYGGSLEITSPSTSAYGIGALIQEKSKFNLTSTGKVKIGGTNNIGFYVQNGGELQISGGTVENTKDGLFAYLDNGKLHFTSSSVPNINYLNVFVTGTNGEIKNDTKILVGTSGLQVANGAKAINSSTGTIEGTVAEARALIGTGTGSTITNDGTIKLSGDKSVALYITDNATATSSGSVEVGKNSAAYYVKDNGLINVSGTTTLGEGSSMFYVDKGRINYTGANILLPNKTTALTLANVPATVNFNNKTLTVGENGAGIYLTKNGELNTANNSIQNLAKINVKKNGSGIYIGNDKTFQSGISIDLTENEALGIYSTGAGNLTYTGLMNSNKNKVKGLVHIGAGDTSNTGILKFTGDAGIGVYAKGGTNLVNRGTVEIGKGITGATAVGLYGENQAKIENTSTGVIKMQKDAIGIYGKNTSIENAGTIQNVGLNNNGIYAVESNVKNTGNISLGDSSNGIYAESVASKIITNTGNVKVGGANSAAIFGGGKTGIKNTAGTITTGANSVGIATIAGDINVSGTTKFNLGESSTYIYTESGQATSDVNLNLDKYGIGMYTKEGKIINNEGKTIKTGLSYVDSDTTKISVAMATEKGEVVNDGTIIVDNKWSVGMLANGKDASSANPKKAVNKGHIQVNGELAYGMMAANESTLENKGTITVAGKNSRGMAATGNSTIINDITGVIKVTGEKAQGIYIDGGSKVSNLGKIEVDHNEGYGIFNGGGTIVNEGDIVILSGGQKTKTETSSLEAGKIKIEEYGKVIFDNVEIINTGNIKLPDSLDFGTMKIGSTAGHIGTISAETFGKGQFLVLPTSTLGTNYDAYTVQYLGGFKNIPNNGELTAISHSVSFIADIQNDVSDPSNPKATIVLARVPYQEMTVGTAASEFGKGLDQLYAGLSSKSAGAPEFEIFDALKMISDKDELGATFDNQLRGNVYANVQRRMQDINDTFTTSFNNLKNNELYSRSRFKAGAIITNGETKDKNVGVEDYKAKTVGTIVMYEKDHAKYGRSSNISLGFTETKFDFNQGSKEKVHSAQIGLGYEDFLGENNWKYSTRGVYTISKHDMKRKIYLSNGTYENRGKYWSEMVEWKNALRYEIPTVGGRLTAGVFGTFDMGYGRFRNIKENGDGVELDIKSENVYSIRPGVGADLTVRHYTKGGGSISLVGTATAEYEAGKIYDGVNQARIKNSNADYYDLEKPKEVRDIYKVGVQMQYETNAGHKLGMGIVREEGSVKSTKYGVNVMYKF